MFGNALMNTMFVVCFVVCCVNIGGVLYSDNNNGDNNSL